MPVESFAIRHSISWVGEASKLVQASGLPEWIAQVSANLPFQEINNWLVALGGTSIVATSLQTSFMGKTLRSIEYPGPSKVKTVTIFRNTPSDLCRAIAKEQDPLYANVKIQEEDIRYVSEMVAPQFTESLDTCRKIRNLKNGSWIVWSRDPQLLIPRRSILLEAFPNHPWICTSEFDQAIQFSRRVEGLTDNERDQVIDLLIDRDLKMLSVFKKHHEYVPNFLQKTRKWLSTINGRNEAMSQGPLL